MSRPHQCPIKYFTSTAFFELAWKVSHTNLVISVAVRIVMGCTTEAANKLSYLDIMIEIEDSCFQTDIYDKREHGFGFHIVSFPP